MDENQLLKRLNEVQGNTLVIDFGNEKAANETAKSAEQLENQGKIDLVELTRYDNYSIAIKAYVK